jgi:hypothetical protein
VKNKHKAKVFGTNPVTEALDVISKAQNFLSRFAVCKLLMREKDKRQKNIFQSSEFWHSNC